MDITDNGATSHYQQWNFTGPDNCHGMLLAPGGAALDPSAPIANQYCGGGAFPPVPGVLSDALAATLGGVCATYAMQAQAIGFIASDGATVPTRTFDISQLGLPLPPQLQCPTF